MAPNKPPTPEDRSDAIRIALAGLASGERSEEILPSSAQRPVLKVDRSRNGPVTGSGSRPERLPRSGGLCCGTHTWDRSTALSARPFLT